MGGLLASLHPEVANPIHFGHRSDAARKLSEYPSDCCPNTLGTVSDLDRNPVRIKSESLSDLRRNTQVLLSRFDKSARIIRPRLRR